eukprot:30154-Pelagococcus_subviridis.AAC.9
MSNAPRSETCPNRLWCSTIDCIFHTTMFARLLKSSALNSARSASVRRTPSDGRPNRSSSTSDASVAATSQRVGYPCRCSRTA